MGSEYVRMRPNLGSEGVRSSGILGPNGVRMHPNLGSEWVRRLPNFWSEWGPKASQIDPGWHCTCKMVLKALSHEKHSKKCSSKKSARMRAVHQITLDPTKCARMNHGALFFVSNEASGPFKPWTAVAPVLCVRTLGIPAALGSGITARSWRTKWLQRYKKQRFHSTNSQTWKISRTTVAALSQRSTYQHYFPIVLVYQRVMHVQSTKFNILE